jgi:hypothetical protein
VRVSRTALTLAVFFAIFYLLIFLVFLIVNSDNQKVFIRNCRCLLFFQNCCQMKFQNVPYSCKLFKVKQDENTWLRTMIANART